MFSKNMRGKLLFKTGLRKRLQRSQKIITCTSRTEKIDYQFFDSRFLAVIVSHATKINTSS